MPPESSDGALDDRARTVEAVRLLDSDGGRSADTHLRLSPLPPVDRCADTYADDHCVSDQSRDPAPQLATVPSLVDTGVWKPSAGSAQ
jgi:hypothetical protein